MQFLDLVPERSDLLSEGTEEELEVERGAVPHAHAEHRPDEDRAPEFGLVEEEDGWRYRYRVVDLIKEKEAHFERKRRALSEGKGLWNLRIGQT